MLGQFIVAKVSCATNFEARGLPLQTSRNADPPFLAFLARRNKWKLLNPSKRQEKASQKIKKKKQGKEGEGHLLWKNSTLKPSHWGNWTQMFRTHSEEFPSRHRSSMTKGSDLQILTCCLKWMICDIVLKHLRHSFPDCGCAQKQRSKQSTETPTSTMAVMGCFPFFMCWFSYIDGLFPQIHLNRPSSLLKVSWQQPIEAHEDVLESQ